MMKRNSEKEHYTTDEKRHLLKETLRRKSAARREGPLSYQQKSLWFMYKLAPGSSAYNVFYLAVINDRVDLNVLRAAILSVVHSHDMLHTAYHQQEEGPWQQVCAPSDSSVRIIDVTDWDEAKLTAYVETEADRPFLLEEGENFRVDIIKNVAKYQGFEQINLLHITVHHIAVDFWSLELLLEEICTNYRAAERSSTSERLAANTSYFDFIDAQQCFLNSEKGHAAEQYWCTKLEELGERTELPSDYSRPSVQDYAGVAKTFEIGQVLTNRIVHRAKQLGVTPFSVCLSAFYILLKRYTNRSDLVVGVPTIGRSLTDSRAGIGYYANPVPIRVQVSDSETAASLTSKVYRTLLEALEHQDYPFALMVDKVDVLRDAGHAPLFQLSFVWDQPRKKSNDDLSIIDRNIVVRQPLRNEQRGSAADITLTIFNKGGPFSGMIRYNTELYSPGTIARLNEYYRTILNTVADLPEEKIAYIELLSAQEKKLLGMELTRRDERVQDSDSIVDLFEIVARKFPSAQAVEYQEHWISYQELDQSSTRVAQTLFQRGVQPGDYIGVFLDRSIDSVIAFIACMKAGGIYVPIDPAYPEERIRHIVKRGRVSKVVTDGTVGSRLATSDVICFDVNELKQKSSAKTVRLKRVDSRQIAYVIFTSGSTGEPKGVAMSHAAVVNLAKFQRRAFAVDNSNKVLQFVSFSFDLSMADLMLSVAAGACLTILPEVHRQDSDAIIRTINEKRITHIQLPASILAILPQESTPSLTTIVIGGEVSSERVLSYWKTNAAVINAYGPTEAAVTATWKSEIGYNNTANIGQPIENVQALVLDEKMMSLPPGTVGEIYLGGNGLAVGYLSDAALSAEKFVPNPYGRMPGDRLYRTGDLGRYEQNRDITFIGRIDSQLHVRGIRIEPGEVEANLKLHPDIEEAVVFTKPDRYDVNRIVAFCVLAEDSPAGEATLREFLKTKLPEHMLPARFVTVARIPLDENGKLNRNALPNPFREYRQVSRSLVIAKDNTERAILDVWRKILGNPSLEVTDNFFDAGGDSIIAIQIASGLNHLGFKATTQQIYQYQTVRQFRNQLADESVTIPTGEYRGPIYLSPIQHWFLDCSMRNRSHFNQFVVVELEDGVDLKRLVTSVRRTVEAHPIFRLRLSNDQTPTLEPDHQNSLEHQLIELSSFSSARAASELECILVQLNSCLDISKGPVFRMAAITGIPNGNDRLALVAHHLYVDAVSWRILLDDITNFYCEGTTTSISNQFVRKKTTFFEWTAKLKMSLDNDAIEAKSEEWLKRLGGINGCDVSSLSHDPIPDYYRDSQVLETVIGARSSRALIESEIYNAQVEEIILAAYLHGLKEYCSKDRFVVNLETHGREQSSEVDVDQTVGWFTGQIPGIFDLKGISTGHDMLRYVKEELRCTKASGHEYAGIRYMSDNRRVADLSGLPSPIFSFNYLGRLGDGLVQFPLKRIIEGQFGASLCPFFERPYRISLDAYLLDDHLTLSIRYNPNFDTTKTVRRIMDAMVSALEDFARHSTEDKEVIYSPSDFPEADISLQELDQILRQVD